MLLGHVIRKDGIVVDPANIKAVINWPKPMNVLDVRAFWVGQVL